MGKADGVPAAALNVVVTDEPCVGPWFSLEPDHEMYTTEAMRAHQKACIYFINSHSSCVLHDWHGMRCLASFYQTLRHPSCPHYGFIFSFRLKGFDTKVASRVHRVAAAAAAGFAFAGSRHLSIIAAGEGCLCGTDTVVCDLALSL
ncbi:MAG: hypothetical protein FRX49_07748 [Trebouxia sp. A1-2]|nr:MAG: hypothetical protein FRX49_07748 [Trebouxia sp. A1-2]